MKTKEENHPPNKQVKDPLIRWSPDTTFTCMSDFSCCYLSRQFGFCFTEATRVLLAGGRGGVGREQPFEHTSTQHNWISQKENNTQDVN